MNDKQNSTEPKQDLISLLSERLRQELSDVPPDEGEVFSILDFLIYSLENEERTYMGNLGLRFSRSMLDMLVDVDRNLGRGPWRYVLLCFQAPFLLARLLSRSRDIRNGLDECLSMMQTFKRLQLVRFVEQSGGSFSTPVIQKWMDIRSFRISEDDWSRLVQQHIVQDGRSCSV